MRDCVHYASCAAVNAYAGYSPAFNVLCKDDSCPFYVPCEAMIGGMKIVDLLLDAMRLYTRPPKPFLEPEPEPNAVPF